MALLHLALASLAVVHDIDDYGARDSDPMATHDNAAAFSSALAAAAPGDTVLAKAGFTYYMHAVTAASLHDVNIQLAGNILVDNNISAWANVNEQLHWLEIVDSTNVTLGGGGQVDGQGQPWWDAAITGSSKVMEDRPNLLQLTNTTDLIIEHLTLLNSPHFHVRFTQCARVVVRFVIINVDRFAQRSLKAQAHARRLKGLGAHVAPLAEAIARRLYGLDGQDDWRDWLLDQIVKLIPAWALQPEDLNTDGIDPNGEDFHVHDCSINNDDDSIAVKPSTLADRFRCSQNMLFERCDAPDPSRSCRISRHLPFRASVSSSLHLTRFVCDTTLSQAHAHGLRRICRLGATKCGCALCAQPHIPQPLDAGHGQGDLRQV